MSGLNPEEILSAVRALLKKSEYCFVITQGERGDAHARLMQPYEPDAEFTLYFGAGPKSRKVREIQKNNRVTVAMMNPQNSGYATLVGRAEITNDAALKSKYWRAHWSDMFPGGPAADEYILIKFIPEQIELMDYTEQAQPQPYWSKPLGLKSIEGRWQVIEAANQL